MKSTHFVIALHEHFTAKASQKTTANTNSADVPAKPGNNTTLPPDTPAPDTPAKDSWALQYINVHLIQPLIEAIDEDGSSFITVNELNDFTSGRPTGWRRVLKLTIYSSFLTYIQPSSLDRILDDRLRDDD